MNPFKKIKKIIALIKEDESDWYNSDQYKNYDPANDMPDIFGGPDITQDDFNSENSDSKKNNN